MEPETVYNHARLYIWDEEEGKTPHMAIGDTSRIRHDRILREILYEQEIPFRTDDHQPGASPGTMPSFNGDDYLIVSLGRCRLTDEGLEIYEFYKGNGNADEGIKNLDELRDLMPDIEIIEKSSREFNG